LCHLLAEDSRWQPAESVRVRRVAAAGTVATSTWGILLEGRGHPWPLGGGLWKEAVLGIGSNSPFEHESLVDWYE